MAKDEAQGPVVIGADDFSQGLVAIREAERRKGQALKAKTVHFEGVCPFLTCLLTNPHDHYICPKCGALRFGALDCKVCRSVHKLAMRISGRGTKEIAKRVAQAEDRLREVLGEDQDEQSPET